MLWTYRDDVKSLEKSYAEKNGFSPLTIFCNDATHRYKGKNNAKSCEINPRRIQLDHRLLSCCFLIFLSPELWQKDTISIVKTQSEPEHTTGECPLIYKEDKISLSSVITGNTAGIRQSGSFGVRVSPPRVFILHLHGADRHYERRGSEKREGRGRRERMSSPRTCAVVYVHLMSSTLSPDKRTFATCETA